MINPKIKYTIEKIQLKVVERAISSEWTIPFEQDVKALYDINIQEDLVNMISEQIAIDIDREIIEGLIMCTGLTDVSRHTRTFCTKAPPSFTWGPNAWFQNILPKLNYLSGVIYNDTKMGAGNIIACNPEDAAIFESLNDFKFTGNSDKDGEIGYQNAIVQGGKYKVVISQNIPVGVMLVLYKGDTEQKASYFYAPYVPVMISPYPLGNNPTMTILTRYAVKAVRPEAVALLAIDRVNTGDFEV